MTPTDFRKSNQLAASLARFIYEVDGLLNTGLEIKPLEQSPGQHGNPEHEGNGKLE